MFERRQQPFSSASATLLCSNLIFSSLLKYGPQSSLNEAQTSSRREKRRRTRVKERETMMTTNERKQKQKRLVSKYRTMTNIYIRRSCACRHFFSLWILAYSFSVNVFAQKKKYVNIQMRIQFGSGLLHAVVSRQYLCDEKDRERPCVCSHMLWTLWMNTNKLKRFILFCFH